MAAAYRVIVVTGTASGAGTDANVYLTILGEKADGTASSSGERQLDTDRDNFEWGQVDVFSIESEDLGTLTSVTIRHDNSGARPGWFLDRVLVEDEESQARYVFPCNRWLARDEDDGQIVRTLYEPGRASRERQETFIGGSRRIARIPSMIGDVTVRKVEPLVAPSWDQSWEVVARPVPPSPVPLLATTSVRVTRAIPTMPTLDPADPIHTQL
ncbi:PLAT/LH2 domain-containing protein [Streptomyces sp. NPDC002688]|uniref:PLAT/LH2 domain-containing protein n=1 Tax=Streptomyces sp. NPDC002688 TaxID=3154423 RepID=UPI00332BDA66